MVLKSGRKETDVAVVRRCTRNICSTEVTKRLGYKIRMLLTFQIWFKKLRTGKYL